MAEKRADEEPTMLHRGISGTFGGICSVVATHPLDTMRIRLQSGKVFLDPLSMRNLYQGILPPLLVVTPISAICFSAYDAFLRALTPYISDATIKSSIAGAGAAIPTTILSVPAERIKIMLQMDSSLTVKDALKRVFLNGGIKEAYRGTSITLFRDTIGCFYWFGAYTFFKEIFKKEFGNDLPIWTIMLSGSLAGAISWTYSLPFDIIKSRIQYAPRKLKISEAVATIAHEGIMEAKRNNIIGGGDGNVQKGSMESRLYIIRSFYRGYGFALARAIPANAISWLGVELMLRALNKKVSI